MTSCPCRLALLAKSGKAGLAKALAQVECSPDAEETVALLDAAYEAPIGHVIGITGPPGVGKSTLLSALIRSWRVRGHTVGIIAVDPSSRRTGGALLGDRTRLITDPEDQGVFIRSMAARDRLGGLATLTVASMVLMRALYDIVMIETVGVGQSETDVASVADTILFCIQPGSGDSLQFMKAGVVEIPHVILVTKADMRMGALRACADVRAALSLVVSLDTLCSSSVCWSVPVILVSTIEGDGVDQVMTAIDSHRAYLCESQNLVKTRQVQATQWFTEAVRERFGREGVKQIKNLSLSQHQSPFRRLQNLQHILMFAGKSLD